MNLDDINSPLPARAVPETKPQEEAESIMVDKTGEEKAVEVSDSAGVNNQSVTKTKTGFLAKNGKLMVILGGIVVLILIIIFVIVFNKPKKQENIVLNYWGLWESEDVMAGVINDYEAKNPGVKINYKRNQLEDYRTRLAARLAKSGTEGVDDVDIYRIHSTWIPMFRNYLEIVPTSTANSIGLDTDFFDVYAKDLKENGKWLSIPLMYDGLALFYNKDLLDQAGIEVPRSWWELEEAAFKLTKLNDQNIIEMAGAGIGTANDNVEHWSDIVGLMAKQNGINFAKNLNVSENLGDALKYYASFAKSKRKVWDGTLPNATELFANGKLAFYFGNSWRVFDIANINKGLNYGITTMPQLPVDGDITDRDAELGNIHWASYWTEGVNNKSKHKDAAWKFLAYLSSNETLEKLYAAESQTRLFGEIYPRKSMVDKLKDNPKVWPFISVADNAESWYLASATSDGGLNTEMQKYFTDAINNLNDNDSSRNAETMTTLKNGISQLQQKYSLKK